jgi:hypothetical protein
MLQDKTTTRPDSTGRNQDVGGPRFGTFKLELGLRRRQLVRENGTPCNVSDCY